MDRAPLILFFNADVAAVAVQLQALAVKHGWIDPASPALPGARDFTLVTQALSLRVSVVEGDYDLAEYERIFLTSEVGGFNTALLVDFDHHLPGAQFIPSVMRAYLEQCATLAEAMDTEAIAWRPARTLVQSGYYIEAVKAFANGGAFPALAFVTFAFEGDNTTVRTQGLGWFAGQELELVCVSENLSRSEMMRRAVRLVHDVAVNGPVTSAQYLTDLDPAARIALQPDSAGSLLLAQIEKA